MHGLVGLKLGMTRFFTEYGRLIPVSVIEIIENRVVQVKSIDIDGYNSIQITTGFKKNKHLSKSLIGHFAKYNVICGRGLWEFRVKNIKKVFPGQIFDVNFFKDIKKVDVIGLSKGKGFAGTVKRWNFKTQDSTHGNSLSHRAPGSIGQNQTPGKVFKNKKMSGHLGNERVTVQNLDIVNINLNYNLLLVKGSIPGCVGSNILVNPSIKYINKGF